MTVRTRIAPSPTGMPHIGTVFQGLIDYAYAHKHNGKFVLRIEDTDQSRYVEGAEEAIYQALDWFGLTPDESPKHGGKYGPYRQSERLELYQKYANQLLADGHAYYCFCSRERLDQVRKKMQKNGQPPMYDKHCRTISLEEAKKRAQSEPHVIRMKIPLSGEIKVQDEIRGEIVFEASSVDDQVIVKSDGFPTYHLAVVVDDHLMQISHLVRGEEWISSSPKHVMLYKYLGWEPPKIIHTPALRNPDKSKLSKRHGHASVSWYLESGYLVEAVLNFLITRVWNHPKGLEIFPLEDTIKYFDWQDMHIQGPIVDLDKLNWYNGQYLRSLSDSQLFERLKQGSGDKSFIPRDCSPELAHAIIPHIKERLVTLADFERLTKFFYRDIEVDQKILNKKSNPDQVKTQLQASVKIIEQLSDSEYQADKLEQAFRSLATENNWKPGQFFMMLRTATTGEKATPPLFDTMQVLGKELTLTRLNALIN